MLTRIALFAAAILIWPTMGQAQMADVSCDDRDRMRNTLETVLGAERQGAGLRDPDTMLEVWVARSSGEWLIVQNYANGTSCIVAMGEHWQETTPGPA